MQTITVEAEKRELVTNGQLKSMRKSGWIPAVVYGSDGSDKKAKAAGAALIKIQEKPFLKSLGRHETSNLIVDLKINNQSTNAIIKEIQKDIISRGLLHVDFQKIVMTEAIEVSIPIHLVGEAPGVKIGGGILEHITRSLRISALPKDIPDSISVDISNLQLGQGLHLADVKPIPGVTFLAHDPAAILIVNVVAPAAEEEVAPAAGAAVGSEPEVIAKGKKPEEGAEGAAAPAAGAKGAAPAAGAKGAAPAAGAKGAAPAAGGKAPAK